MRIWHESLIPKLCQKHLCAMWREGLGCYAIITQGKSGYANHPATIEWISAHDMLWEHLRLVRREMIKRGYNPKEMPIRVTRRIIQVRIPWQSLDEQIAVLKAKGCKCNI